MGVRIKKGEEEERLVRLGVDWYGEEIAKGLEEKRGAMLGALGQGATYTMMPIVHGGLNYVVFVGMSMEGEAVKESTLKEAVAEIGRKMFMYSAGSIGVANLDPDGGSWEGFVEMMMEEFGDKGGKEVWLWEEVGEEG